MLGATTVVIVVAFRSASLEGTLSLAESLASRDLLPWFLGVAAFVLISLIGVRRYRVGHPNVFHQSLAKAWQAARGLSARTLVATGALTLASVAVRVAVLPILGAAYVADLDILNTAVGSFALLYSQLILPTPSGVGMVKKERAGIEHGVGEPAYVPPTPPKSYQEELALRLLDRM